MNDNGPFDNDEWEIQIEYTPEYRRKILEIGLQNTRKRAGQLLADLLEEVREVNPDLEKIKQLAEGIEEQSKRARRLTLGLCRS